jgi:D-alanyl-D-alanine carboxypeptidase
VVTAGAPGAIAWVRVGGQTMRLASGHSTLAPERPMRAALRARIGGITKTFTATVVLQLVAEHRLALDDSLEQLLPGVISNGEDISIRQLLNHTSGIFDYVKDPRTLAPYEAGDLTLIFDPADGIQYAAEHGPQFVPGEGFEYSNTNYLLLAMIAETITGRSIGSLLRTRIFAPLRLGRTSYPMTSQINGPHVHGYLADQPRPDVTDFSPTVSSASGAILSNAEDLARFYEALLRGRLIPRRLLNEMQTIDPVATGGIPDAGILGGGWGLGLLRENFPCGEAWGHDSESLGYMTAAWSNRTATRQVVVFVNSNYDHDAPVSQAMREVLAAAYCGDTDRR